MCRFCCNRLNYIYDFNYNEKIKKTINIATYISLRNISNPVIYEDMYVVCRSLYRSGCRNGLIQGKLNIDSGLNPLHVLCFATGSIKRNYIEMLTIIPDREK